jgi:hypothetical protein
VPIEKLSTGGTAPRLNNDAACKIVPSPPSVTTKSMFSDCGPGRHTSAPSGLSGRSSENTFTPGYIFCTCLPTRCVGKCVEAHTRKNEQEEVVNRFYDRVCPKLVYDEDGSWRVRSVLVAMISNEYSTRPRERRRTFGLGPMARICLSTAVSSRPGRVATYALQKPASMVLVHVEILAKTSCEGHGELGRGYSWPMVVVARSGKLAKDGLLTRVVC